jgi:hypothetical protein
MMSSTAAVWSSIARLLLLAGILSACAGAKKGSSSAGGSAIYQEDLSAWGPAVLKEKPSEQKNTEEPTQSLEAPSTLVDHGTQIEQVLDSLRQWNRRIKFIQGYRLLIYNGKDRDMANQAKGFIYTYFPQAPVWTEYKQPYFKVKVGNYIQRIEAQSMLALLRKNYPQVILVPEQIKIAELLP